MRRLNARHWRWLAVVGLLSTLMATGGILVAQAVSGDDDVAQKTANEPAPPTFATDQERTEFERTGIATAIASSADFRKQFVDEGRAVDSLPHTTIQTMPATDGSLASALKNCTIVVVGSVISQRVELDGYVASTLRVEDTLAGTSDQEVILIQPGEPSISESGPVFVETDANPILAVGHEYLLFLRPAGATTDGKYVDPLGNSGFGETYEVADGRLRALGDIDDAKAELDGVELATARAAIAAGKP